MVMLSNLANIIKYDWMRRWKFFLAGLVVFAVVNTDLTARLISKGRPTLISGVLIAVLFTMAGALVVDHLGRMYKPLFSGEGTFLFSTPLSGYSILGGKILAVALEYIGVALFVTAVFTIDYFVLARHLIEMQLPDGISFNLFLTRGLQVNLLLLMGYLLFVLTFYLSVALSKSLLSSFKYGGLLSFIIFMCITQLFPHVAAAFLDVNPIHISVGPQSPAFTGLWLSAVGFAAAAIAVLFLATGYLLDRKVNV